MPGTLWIGIVFYPEPIFNFSHGKHPLTQACDKRLIACKSFISHGDAEIRRREHDRMAGGQRCSLAVDPGGEMGGENRPLAAVLRRRCGNDRAVSPISVDKLTKPVQPPGRYRIHADHLDTYPTATARRQGAALEKRQGAGFPKKLALPIHERLPQPLVLAALQLDQLGNGARPLRLNGTAGTLGGASGPLLHLALGGSLRGDFCSGLNRWIRGGGRRGFSEDHGRQGKGDNNREEGGEAEHEVFWLHREKVPAL